MTFLEAVNRVLRITGIIKGDDDSISTFLDLQHNATLNLAQISIQSELNSLIADSFIPIERDSATITTVAGTRTYALDPSFVRFWGTAKLYQAANNQILYPFDEDTLIQQIPNYKTVESSPIYWYFVEGAVRTIGFYPVPDAADSWEYDFEKSVAVTDAADVLPFYRNEEAQTFCNLAARRFLILYEEQPDKTLITDAIYQTEKSILLSLISGTNASRYYGTTYA